MALIHERGKAHRTYCGPSTQVLLTRKGRENYTRLIYTEHLGRNIIRDAMEYLHPGSKIVAIYHGNSKWGRFKFNPSLEIDPDYDPDYDPDD